MADSPRTHKTHDPESNAAPDWARSLSIVVLAFNRREALADTLGSLEHVHRAGGEIIVVDNASSDGTSELVQARFAWARLITLERNLGVDGFNRGAERATRELVLILDDDATPRPGSLERAVAIMLTNPKLGGLMLHRLHPRTGKWEWPFERIDTPQDDWPDMGCGNLVRRQAWQRVGGYEAGFFLYRNDTDLALKLLAAGYETRFDPALVVLHDSKVVHRQKPRWFRLSTRNWVWMCRRHGSGMIALQAIALGWLWAHKLAGLSPRRQAMALVGGISGMVRAHPPLPDGLLPDGQRPDGSALRRLVHLKRTVRYRRGRGRS